jgi:phosphohistidine swiveling domain-containing protein
MNNNINNKKLPKIMYDQTQYTSIWMIDKNGFWISDSIYEGMKKIGGYAPDRWITYTQNKPVSFFFGAYDLHALDKESEIGFKNFTNKDFVKKFEEASKNVYKKTKSLALRYFSNFYGKEKKALNTNKKLVIDFLNDAHNLATYIMSYYLLTQPQQFYKLEKELSSFLPNKDLELISTTGRYLTYISKLRKAILDAAKNNKEVPKKEINKYGFLNWSIFGGDLITEQRAKKEIKELRSHPDKLDKELGEINDLVKRIRIRNKIVNQNHSKIINLADIMGHASVIRFNLQTCMLCIVKYADNFVQVAREKYKLSQDEIKSYTWDEILNLINSGIKQNKKTTEDRQIGFLRIYTNKGSKTFVGYDARSEIKNLLEFRQKEINQSSYVSGSTASFPNKSNHIIKGRAFVLTTAFNIDKIIKDFKEGDILIATQTHPNIVPQMKIAKAIVTDEGGITCHAAIVSRELNKPCIIGTRLATKIFKTGDMLELDLKKGIVRKI